MRKRTSAGGASAATGSCASCCCAIGITDLADAQLDEYEHYAGQLARRLRAGASDEEIAAVLEGFRADMGLEPSAELPLGVARSIRDWYRSSTAPRSE
jgi:hypothetical protein